ncbi:MAG: PEP-CTERM sorting domain-containing protein [Bythopirellula sp.]
MKDALRPMVLLLVVFSASGSGLCYGLSSLFTFSSPPDDVFVTINGTVDGEDLMIWENSYGGGNGADADQDGDSDGRDYLIWQQNYGNGLPLAAHVAVPEPSSLLLIASAVVGGWTRRIRRTRSTV